MSTEKQERTLASRLGQTAHASPLRFKIRRLMNLYPTSGMTTLEDWLLDIANHRGVKSVSRLVEHLTSKQGGPSLEELSNAELVIAICQPQNLDRPQWLRAAAELISKKDLDLDELRRKIRPERVERILAELSRQALRADPDHDWWKEIHEETSAASPLSDSLIHWTRLTTKKPHGHTMRCKFIDRPLAR